MIRCTETHKTLNDGVVSGPDVLKPIKTLYGSVVSGPAVERNHKVFYIQ